MSKVPRRRWATRAELLERIELTRTMIVQSPGQDISIKALAGIAGLSESHFIRLFGDTYGISPGKMLATIRLETAKHLLCKGLDVNEVALDVGYSSLPTFCRRFKETFGATPKQFKKRNLG